MPALLEIEHLSVEYRSRGQRFRAVDDVSLTVEAGGSVGIVGESGCGKSTLAKAVVGLEPIAAGAIRFEGRSIAEFDATLWRAYRREVQLVFQDSLGALNPRLSVGGVLDEVLRVHARRECPSADTRRTRVRELLDLVELSIRLADRYPHELSGGQRQRIALARALAVRPKLLIADEPVSALDVAVQAQIIHLLHRLRSELGVATLFIAHDLAVVRALCPTAHVLHRGRVVECGATDALFTHPQADYTRTLLAAVPDVFRGLAARRAPEGVPA
jgi:ABC-type glutathione transport system ATPase component